MFRGISALFAVLATSLALAACGGDDAPDTDGGLSASELAAKLPDAGSPQAAAVDVEAAKEAAGVPADADPLTLGSSPAELRFAQSTYFGLRSLSLRSENPLRSAMDHSLVTAYAANPYVSDDAVTLVSTSQDFEAIASSLEDAGWEREGDVLSTDGDPADLGYTAAAAGEGFLVLGNTPEGVEAVASGDAEPSETGEIELLDGVDAPAVYTSIPETAGLECVDSIIAADTIDGKSTVTLAVDDPDKNRVPSQLERDVASIGFSIASITEETGALVINLEGLEEEGLANSPALFVFSSTDDTGPLLYDCK